MSCFLEINLIACFLNIYLFEKELKSEITWYFYKKLYYIRKIIGHVAQLNRALDFGSSGRGFESLRGHYNLNALLVFQVDAFFCFFSLIFLLVTTWHNNFVGIKLDLYKTIIKIKNKN